MFSNHKSASKVNKFLLKNWKGYQTPFCYRAMSSRNKEVLLMTQWKQTSMS